MSRKLVFLISAFVLAGTALAQAANVVGYYDERFAENWTKDESGPVRDELIAAGYEILDADQLKTWMDDRIADGTPSAVIFCRDYVPDTVAETNTSDCTLRRYLDRGGKVVWWANIPFWKQVKRDGTEVFWGASGLAGILDMPGAVANGTNTIVTLTDAAVEWGLTETWESRRRMPIADTTNVTILATDAAGNVAGWVKHFVPGDKVSGFVRVWDFPTTPTKRPRTEDLIRLAEYGLTDPSNAYSPSPGNGVSDVPRDTVLSWHPGQSAVSHDLYFGKSLSDVTEASVASPLGAVVVPALDVNTFDPGRLDFHTTYYWRVDEVNNVPSPMLFKGEVWSFSTEALAYPVPNVHATASSSKDPVAAGPQNTVNGSGLTLASDGQYVHDTTVENMWQSATDGLPATIAFEFDQAYKLHSMKVWNHNTPNEDLFGLGAKEVTVEVANSSEGPWTFLADVTLNKAPGLPNAAATDTIPMRGVMASNVRLTIHSSHGGLATAGLAEVQFFYLPVAAREMAPEDGTVLDDTQVTLTWRGGRETAQHELYLAAEDKRALVESSDPAVLAASITAQGPYASYAASGLILSQTYVWKVVEVNAAEVPASHESPVYSFTIPEYLVVDDMESYKNVEFQEIWATWLDGTEFGTNDPTNGSIVGADPGMGDYGPAPGQNSGQSLPIWFDNRTASRSEAIRTFGSARNWAQSGITTLRLFVRVGAENTGGSLYVKINGTKIALVDNSTYPPGFDRDWEHIDVDLTGIDVSKVQSLAVGVEGAGAKGVIYVDDVRLCMEAQERVTVTWVGSVVEAESGTLTVPFQVLSDKPEASGGQYIIVPNGIGNSNNDPAAQTDGWAVYTINIPADGNYAIAIRGLTERPDNNGDDSIWVNIPGMIVNDGNLHSSGFVRGEGMFRHPQGSIVWDFILDNFGGTTDPVVFTLTAGQHELQISRREDGTGLDAIALFAVE